MPLPNQPLPFPPRAIFNSPSVSHSSQRTEQHTQKACEFTISDMVLLSWAVVSQVHCAQVVPQTPLRSRVSSQEPKRKESNKPRRCCAFLGISQLPCSWHLGVHGQAGPGRARAPCQEGLQPSVSDAGSTSGPGTGRLRPMASKASACHIAKRSTSTMDT